MPPGRVWKKREKGIGCLMDIPEAKASTSRCFLFHSEGPESSRLLVDLVGRLQSLGMVTARGKAGRRTN